jgi:hypothetical protein
MTLLEKGRIIIGLMKLYLGQLHVSHKLPLALTCVTSGVNFTQNQRFEFPYNVVSASSLLPAVSFLGGFRMPALVPVDRSALAGIRPQGTRSVHTPIASEISRGAAEDALESLQARQRIKDHLGHGLLTL